MHSGLRGSGTTQPQVPQVPQAYIGAGAGAGTGRCGAQFARAGGYVCMYVGKWGTYLPTYSTYLLTCSFTFMSWVVRACVRLPTESGQFSRSLTGYLLYYYYYYYCRGSVGARLSAELTYLPLPYPTYLPTYLTIPPLVLHELGPHLTKSKPGASQLLPPPPHYQGHHIQHTRDPL